MKQVIKVSRTPGAVQVLQAELTIDDAKKWSTIYCPLSSSDGSPCGEWCAWYDEEPVSVKLNDRLSASSGRVVATCKGTPIGEIVEAP